LADVTVIIAVAHFDGSARLVAHTVTVPVNVAVAGRLYNPVAEIDPTAGESDQSTAVLAVPVTVAVNCT
jgi:hypothetical protein